MAVIIRLFIVCTIASLLICAQTLRKVETIQAWKYDFTFG